MGGVIIIFGVKENLVWVVVGYGAILFEMTKIFANKTMSFIIF